MAWFRAGGGGIPSSLKSDMNDVFNKKFGTVLQNYPPEEWPADVNLMGPLPERTVSGSVVAFADGADDVPLKSCAVTIAPTLDGVSSVGVVHCGKNLCNPSDVGNYAISGTDGSISANANSLATYNKIPVGTNSEISVSCGDYCDVRGIYCYGANDSFLGRPGALGETNQMTRTLVSGTTHIRVTFRGHGGGAVSPSDLTSAQIEFGSSSTDYSPYVSTTHTANLGRTIYGGSVDVVNGTGTDEYTFDLWDGTQNYNVSDNLTNVFRIYMAHAKPLPDVTAVQCICDGYTFPRAGWTSDTVSFYSDANNFTLKLPKTEVTTLEQAKAWLAQHNVTFLYATTPEDFTFTATPIISRLGDNTMWGDGDLSVTYRRDIDLALAQ